MESPGTSTAYKLPGAPGSTACTKDLCKIPAGYISTSPAGQLHCSSLHKQSRGNCFTNTDSPGKVRVAVGPKEGNNDWYIPGVSNMIGDNESRLEGDRSDWMLARSAFLKINQVLDPLEVDLFASRLSHQLPQLFSWRPDPLAEAVDAFQQDWSKVRGYANPP